MSNNYNNNNRDKRSFSRGPYKSGGGSYYKKGGSGSYNSNKGRFSQRGGGRRGFSKKQIDPSKYISKTFTPTNDDIQDQYEGKSFTNFNLSDFILNNLTKKNFLKTTHIQEATIPLIQTGKDVLGISATGSGKTGAFLIPLIDKLYKSSHERILIIAPTRELALQILQEGVSLVKGTRIRLELVIGGESISRQIGKLRRRPEIVVGTPGRLLDMEKRKILDFAQFKNIIIDEVDRMLDMGFIKDIEFIYNKTPATKQTLFFSATINRKIETIIKGFSTNYELVKLAENKPVDHVFQDIVYFNQNEEKLDLLANILEKEDVKKTVIFVDTKRYADKVGKYLYGQNIDVGVIHGDKSQSQRKRILNSFRSSKFNILVATNVASRGLDIDDISHVINLDEPGTYDEYIHRIGRTGRNGKKGIAYTFVHKRQSRF